MQTAIVGNDEDEARRQARITGEINAFVVFTRGAIRVIEKLEHARAFVTDCLEFLERRGLKLEFEEWRRSRSAPSDAETEPCEVVELGPAGNNAPSPPVGSS